MFGWLFYALLTLVLWGLWGVFSKIASSHLPGVIVYLVEVAVYLAVGGLIWLQMRPPFDWNYAGLIAAAAAGLSGGFALFFFFKALSLGPAAVIVPMTSLYPVITVILGIVFLQESLTARQLAGIMLAVAAFWLLSK